MKKRVEIFEILKTRFPEKNVEVRDPENFYTPSKISLFGKYKIKIQNFKISIFRILKLQK